MIIRQLSIQSYEQTWLKMKEFTMSRTDDSMDEFWLLEHHPVYTQGQAGKPEHILNADNIPIVQSDRGGQVTYHGPGQLVGYILMDIKRKNLGIRTLVSKLEAILIELLEHYGVTATRKCGAPGVYVNDKKIASIGLRVKNGCTYHGIALNINMDLKPFRGINPCGFANMQMTQLCEFVPEVSIDTVRQQLKDLFLSHFDTQ